MLRLELYVYDYGSIELCMTVKYKTSQQHSMALQAEIHCKSGAEFLVTVLFWPLYFPSAFWLKTGIERNMNSYKSVNK